ncbi:phenylalanine--tRNA ligase subunit beta [Pleomorphovibrio marinus]|uniref:phenylalanine--tRNA ligase subunit beta n=1 Tax=Pleomorphovibrio marinus TaxID=2164132 RepID=UPI000E0A6ADA|nr:phenylalanine--tRNA ligase subunit beta [Pleomorphovibrio marinus]
MKIAINRLREFVPFDHSAEEIAEMLTASGLEVEGIETFESVKGSLEGIVIGEVISCDSHPNADKLKVCKVDIGQEILPIVCGAPNVAKAQKVAVATVGSTLYTYEGKEFPIKKAKIRGEVSQGMICAEDELGLGESHEGIMVLETDLPNGTPANSYFKIVKSEILEIGLTPNRADAASHFGVARDIKALLKKEVVLPNVDGFKTDNEELVIDVEVQDHKDCPRYAGLTISGVNVGPSPDWLQNYLKAIGLDPINNLVDITNFILHDLGQPLHAFDADKIRGKKLIIKKLPKGSKFITLDEKERELNGEELMICDPEGGLCIAGIFGGVDSGISSETKNLFLESAYFSPDVIRKGAQFHGIKSDASFRFERGTDPNMPVYALKRAAMLIKEIAGGKISSPIVDVYPEPISDVEIPVRYKNVDRLIGKKLERRTILEILKWLEIKTKDENEEGFVATVKPYRVDVTREADIIEEILRIYGFESIPLQEQYQSDFLASHPAKDADKLQFRVSELLSGIGFHEIITNSLTKAKYSEKAQEIQVQNNVVILNKLSEDLGVMRQSLLYTGLESVSYNINRRQRDLRLFEFGTVYRKEGERFLESKRLSFFLTGNRHLENWRSPSEGVVFADLYQVVEGLLVKLNIQEYEVFPVESEEPFVYSLSIRVGAKHAGNIGLLTEKARTLCEVKQEVFFGELDWDLLVDSAMEIRNYQEISKFPEVRRDLSLVLDKSVTFSTLSQLAYKEGGKLLNRIGVFDVYKGDKIGATQKAYALSFFLQDQEKTLTDKVIDKTMNRLMQTFEKEAGAIIRK